MADVGSIGVSVGVGVVVIGGVGGDLADNLDQAVRLVTTAMIISSKIAAIFIF